MPMLFKQACAILQVAAVNEAGQSAWATLKVPLHAGASEPIASPLPKGQVPQKDGTAASPGGWSTRQGQDSDASPSESPGNASLQHQCKEFEAKAISHRGAGLLSWLRRQSKGLLVAWLRSQNWPCGGSKEDIVGRVCTALTINVGAHRGVDCSEEMGGFSH